MPGQESGPRPWWTPASGVLLWPAHTSARGGIPWSLRAIAVGSQSPRGMASMSCQRCSTSPHRPTLFLGCFFPTQQLPRAVRESRPVWSWACPFTGDTAQLRGIATPPAQSGGRHKRPGTGQHEDLSPPQARAFRFGGCDDPTSMAPLSCRCLGGQMSLHTAAKGLMTMLNSLDMGGDTRVSHQ